MKKEKKCDNAQHSHMNQYGEEIPTNFAWIDPDKQKKMANKLAKIGSQNDCENEKTSKKVVENNNKK